MCEGEEERDLCLYDVCVCMTLVGDYGSTHKPWHTCGVQKTTSDVGPHPPPCLRLGLLLFVSVYIRLTDPQASEGSPVCLLTHQKVAGIADAGYRVCLFVGPRVLNWGLQACIPSAYNKVIPPALSWPFK